MSIQSIGSIQQTMGPMRTDFQNFSAAAKNLQSALNSGNQDQVTLSESALQQALGPLFINATNAQGQSSSASGNTDPMQAFLNDLQTLQSALTSANGTQSASSSTSTMTTALNNVLNDLSYFTQGQTGDAGGNNDGNIVS